MERVKSISYKNKQIILVDLSDTQPNISIAVLPEAAQLISKQEKGQALIMTDVTGAVYNKEVAAAIKKFTANNTPFVKASAVVGAEGIQAILLQTVIFLTRREIKNFPNRDEAMVWLASL